MKGTSRSLFSRRVATLRKRHALIVIRIPGRTALVAPLCGAGRRVRLRPCNTRQRAPRRPGTFQTGSWSDCPGCRLPPSVSLAHQPTKLSTVSRLVNVFHALKRELFVGSLGSHRESRVTEAAIGSLAAGRISVSRMLVSIPSDVRNLEFGQLILIAGLSACVLSASGGVRACANIRSKAENCANGAEVCRVQQECALLRVEFSLQQGRANLFRPERCGGSRRPLPLAYVWTAHKSR